MMKKNGASRLGVALILAILTVAAGCTTTVTFVGFEGDEVAVDGAWTIAGAPASAATCGAASTIALEVYENIGSDNYEIRTPCASGGFVTDRVLLAGSYQVRWVAYDRAGVALHTSDFSTPPISVGFGETIEADYNFPAFPPVVSGDVTTLSGMWQINGVQADATSCTAAGISTIRFEVANDPAGTDIAYQFDFQCARGSFDSRTDADASDVVLPRGIMFYSHYQALDAGGGLVGETDYLELDTAAVTHAITATPDFTFAVENTLRINFFWETGMDTEDFVTCADAMIDETIGYTLTDSSGATVVEMFGVSCEDALDFTPVASDIYSIDITAMAGDGTKWGAICSDLDVVAGLEEYDCQVMVVP